MTNIKQLTDSLKKKWNESTQLKWKLDKLQQQDDDTSDIELTQSECSTPKKQMKRVGVTEYYGNWWHQSLRWKWKDWQKYVNQTKCKRSRFQWTHFESSNSWIYVTLPYQLKHQTKRKRDCVIKLLVDYNLHCHYSTFCSKCWKHLESLTH